MNLKNKGIKAIILIIGTIILATGYIGSLIFTVRVGIESVYINVIATIIFLFLYFGLFVTVKNYRKGYLKENKNNIINLLYLTIPFIVAILAYILTRNIFIVFISFIVAQIMYTIYYKNYFPVPGYNRAYKLYRNNDMKNALFILDEVLKKHPNNYETLVLLGVIYKNNIEYKEAIKYLEKASTIRPSNIRPLINLIHCHLCTEDINKAIEISEKSLEVDPENWNLNYITALSYYLKKDFKKAIEYFKKASKLNVHPLQLFLVHYGLAESLLRTNLKEEASTEFKNSKRYAYKSSINYWENQLKQTQNNMNKANMFVKEALEFVKKEDNTNKTAK